MRRTPLKRRRKPAAVEPGREEWKAPVFGHCRRCGTVGLLTRHHVVYEQHVRAAGGDPWRLDNALLLGHHFTCGCHNRHHSGFHRLPLELLPEAAVAFAVDVLGEERAAAYFVRHYDCGVERTGGDRVVALGGSSGAALDDTPTGPLNPALFDTEPQSDGYKDVE